MTKYLKIQCFSLKQPEMTKKLDKTAKKHIWINLHLYYPFQCFSLKQPEMTKKLDKTAKKHIWIY